MGIKLKSEVERQLIEDLKWYGIIQNEYRFDWSDCCIEGHRTKYLDGAVENFSSIMVFNAIDELFADGWMEFIHEDGVFIEPRSRYGFIHGELGPDHVLFNDRLEPYLIDIEGAEFFDIEHEHSFLQFRFGDYYRYLKNDTLDPNRMLFYRFHHHISLTSGGLKLLHRGFPDQQFAKDLTDHHSRCVLRFIKG